MNEKSNDQNDAYGVILDTVLRILSGEGPATYDQRKISRYEADWGFVSTAHTTDSGIETGVLHKGYPCEDGQTHVIIVETYDDEASAILGHERWAKRMESDPPDELVDVGKAPIALMAQKAGATLTAKRRNP